MPAHSVDACQSVCDLNEKEGSLTAFKVLFCFALILLFAVTILVLFRRGKQLSIYKAGKEKTITQMNETLSQCIEMRSLYTTFRYGHVGVEQYQNCHKEANETDFQIGMFEYPLFT